MERKRRKRMGLVGFICGFSVDGGYFYIKGNGEDLKLSKNIKGARIKADKEKIIAMYDNDILILDIAKKYGVLPITLRRHLIKWGVPIKRKIYNYRQKKVKKSRLKVSSVLLAQREANTKINDKHIHYIKFKNTTRDQKLVANIIRHPIIG